MNNFILKKIKVLFPLSAGDFVTMAVLETAAMAAGFVLIYLGKDIIFVTLIFMLSVVLISRFTHGYFFGSFSSLISAIAINILYSEFSPSKNSLTSLNYLLSFTCVFVCVISVSIITCALTEQSREKEKIRIQAEKEKIKSNFLRAISHDLRTPLTSILGSNSAVLENFDTLSREEMIALLKNVNEESLWLIRMVENILSITRIDANDAKISKQYEAVEEIVGEAVQKFKKRFPTQAVTVKVPQEILLVPVDAVLIEQVLINLLENVIKHSGGSDIITVSVTQEKDDAVFEVSDNGRGISAEVFPQLFIGEIHGKENNCLDKSLGIGLSVCMSIIKAHGGTIEAENRKNGGATVRFRLPLEGEEHYEQQADYTYS
jgi:two-component system sensor histidine kinase KdpD